MNLTANIAKQDRKSKNNFIDRTQLCQFPDAGFPNRMSVLNIPGGGDTRHGVSLRCRHWLRAGTCHGMSLHHALSHQNYVIFLQASPDQEPVQSSDLQYNRPVLKL
jgi:hypothetical protein